MRQILGFDGMGSSTAPTAGTPFTVPLPPKKGMKLCLDSVVYTPAGTSHTLTVMRCIGRTTVASTAAAGQAVINLTANPGPTGNALAANDYVVIKRAADGLLYTFKVLSVSTLAFTMTANVGTGVPLAAGDKVYMFGAVADTDPSTGLTNPNYALATGAQRTVTNTNGNGLVTAGRMDEPILLYIDNVTAAGAFDRASWMYVYEPGTPRNLLGENALADDDGEDEEAHQGALGDRLKQLPWGQIVDSIIDRLLARLGGGK